MIVKSSISLSISIEKLWPAGPTIEAFLGYFLGTSDLNDPET